MRRLALVLLLLGLTACSKRAELKSFSDEAVKVNVLHPPAPSAAPDAAPAAGSVPLLAYAYDYTLSLPADQIQSALARDQQACASAGPQACQLVGSSLSREGRSIASAHLDLRATPAWVARYRAGIAGQTQAQGGRVETENVQSEDLSRSIVDSEAAIRAQATLRDRIERLLAERPGKLSDVLDAERELAKVQGELDATQSELAVMRTRVETSKLAIDYHAQGVAAPDGVARPLQDAANGFARNAMFVFATLLTIASFILPLVLVIAPLVWLALFLSRRRKPAPRPKPTDPAG